MPDTPEIITFCNSAYIPVLANFLAAPGAPAPAALTVYGLDPETTSFAEQAGAIARPLDWSGSLGVLWKARLKVFQDLLAEGRSFVHTDVDALWLRTPLDALLAPEPDMTFSQGTIHPPEGHEARGFVLCCGLFRMNATDAARRFLERVADDIPATSDDQSSVNRVLLADGVVWDGAETPDYRLRMRGKRFSCWKRTLIGRAPGDGLTVGLTPHGLVQRIHDPVDTVGRVHVSHPLSPKSAKEKLNLFSELGLLFVSRDRDNTPVES